jgi:hypothetical protein
MIDFCFSIPSIYLHDFVLARIYPDFLDCTGWLMYTDSFLCRRVNMKKTRLWTFLSAVWIFLLFSAPCRPDAKDYFLIEVVDEQTGRGVPLVELRTTSQIRLYTDSGGLAVFNEPGLMGQTVFLFVESPGYEFPADGFGMRGIALDVQPGKTAKIKLKRINIAQRLYRLTGQGIYRDSVLAGRPVPIKQPLLNAQVCGQDSVNNCLYRGTLYWFWGDTSRVSYGLGHFATAGAVSDLPGKGGLDPDRGVDLTYFADESGFSRPMFPISGPGMVWIDGLMTVKDSGVKERMLCHFARMKDLGHFYERGIGVYNDDKQCFEPILRDTGQPMPYSACGHPVPVQLNGISYWYFPVPFPASVRMRVRATLIAASDPNQYEILTAIGQKAEQAGARWIAFGTLANKMGSRSAAQKALEQEHQKDRMTDIESRKPITPHGGSVCWNRWRQRWLMIFNQSGGESSNLGEVWYAEAPTPAGPWTFARKIITHNRYSFYNPKQHPYFDRDNGRIVYLEGTYSFTFSGDEKQATPRYDYNQVMYRLDLSDPRLKEVWDTQSPESKLRDPPAKPDESMWNAID